MPELNLLPWREAKQKRKVKALLIDFCFSIFIGIVIITIWTIVASQSLSDQQDRNTYLLQQNNVFVRTSSKILVYRKQKTQILKQLQLLSGLEKSRQTVLDTWSELSDALPKTVYLTNISRYGNQLRVMGFAEHKKSISDFIRALEQKEIFYNPTLSAINLVVRQGKNVENSFKITVEIKAKSGGIG